MTVMMRAVVAVSCLNCAILRYVTILLLFVVWHSVALPSSFLSQGFEVLSKYVALYAANLIKDGNTLKALDLYCRYGAPANPQVNICQQIVHQDILCNVKVVYITVMINYVFISLSYMIFIYLLQKRFCWSLSSWNPKKESFQASISDKCFHCASG